MLKKYEEAIKAQVKEEARFWFRVGGDAVIAVREPFLFEFGYKDDTVLETIYFKYKVTVYHCPKDSNINRRTTVLVRVDKNGANVYSEEE